MAKKESTSGELEADRSQRVLAKTRSNLVEHVHLLQMAYRAKPYEALEELIRVEEEQLLGIDERIGAHMNPRRKPSKIDSKRTCLVFIDECGSHNLRANEHELGAFAVAAVIIAEEDIASVDQTWKQWKTEYLGRDKITHEPDIRKRKDSFWCSGDTQKQDQAIEALDAVIPALNFTGVACVLHRKNYVATHGLGPIDESVTPHPYLMMVVFLLERLCFALEYSFGGARARIIFESRGPKEDALVQLEVAKLFMYGTT